MGGGRLKVPASLALCLLAATACGGAQGPQAGATPGSTPTAHLTASYSNVVPDNLPLWIAKDSGIFKAHGLDVDLQLINSTTGMPALLSGQTQFADIGGSEALSAAAAGADVVVLANLTPVAPYVFYSAPPIPDVSGLRGKKVGTTSPGGSADIATQLALRQLKLDPSGDVTVVNLGSVSNLTAAMLNGAVQASVSHPPESSQFEARGFHRLLDLARQKIPFATTTVVTKKSYLAANRGVVQRYIDSVVEGIARERRDRALAVRTLKKYYRSEDDALMGGAYDYYAKEVVQLPPYSQAQQFAASQAVLGQKSDAVRAFQLSKLFDNSLVRSAANRGLAKT
jgi:NitT/TauT family transport system substrate-binding protein